MINRVGAFILVSLFSVGCGVGDDGDGDDKIEDNDPNPNGLLCSDAFTVTGTFTPGTPARPQDPVDPTIPLSGCWPVGTWTFSVALDTDDANVLDITGDQKPDRCGAVKGTQAAPFETGGYSFIVNRSDNPDVIKDTYSFVGATPSGETTIWKDKLVYRIKVTEGGGGECEAGVELYSRDGKSYWNLHPALTGTTLTGFGDFYLYEEPQI